MKRKIVYGIIFSVLFSGVLGFFSFRWDFTAEKRYTLTDVTVSTLESVRKPMFVEVYLEGDFPASFRQFQEEIRFTLEEFRKINPKIEYEFIDPIKNKISQDTLQAMGMQPSVLPDMKDGKLSEIVLFPYAVIKYNNYGVSLPLIIQQTGISFSDQLNKSMENLEYNFVSNIKSIIEEKKKNIGFLVNHQELGPEEFQGFLEMVIENYNIGPIVPADGKELGTDDFSKMKQMDAIVIAKPRKPFTDREKLLIDQYIMGGGKTLWMIDAINAEMDTLFLSKKIMAYPMDLNLTDFMFNYGVRINTALVKDLKKPAVIRIAAGEVAGNPQYRSFPWLYFPLGINENQNPITKNLNPVKFEFPTSIDTLYRKNIRKEVLYESSEMTRIKTVPNYIELSEIARMDSIGAMERVSMPKIFAVSLKGDFTSAYANRSESSEFPGFRSQGKDNKMVVIADGDVARNQILNGEPLPLGVDLLTNQRYGNEQFLSNVLDYLLDDDNLIGLRSRNIENRLLNRNSIEEDRAYWQWFNLLLPILVVAFCGGMFYWCRRKYFG